MAQTVTPYLLYEDAEAAVEFLTRAFGFRTCDDPQGHEWSFASPIAEA
jgi:uncharacterized glyoxalase superfamily protein PhnB